MNVTTMPASRQNKAQQRAPRSGGRTTEREHYAVDGATALQPEPASRVRSTASTQEHRTQDHRAPDHRPARLTVTPPAPVSAPRAPFVALVLVLVLTGVVGILVLNTKIAENAFVLDALHHKQDTLDRNEQQVKSDLAQKESPAYLENLASGLGLGKPTNNAFLVLPDGTKLQMPGPTDSK
jgi:hypothetical protein